MRKIGQNVYTLQVGDDKIPHRDHRQFQQRAPDPSGRAVTFQLPAGDPDTDDDSEEDHYTSERIL